MADDQTAPNNQAAPGDRKPPDPNDDLYWLLRAFAVERDELYRQIGAAKGEADRLRATLRRWRAEHSHCFRRGPTNQGRWGSLRW